ncbi:Asp23/Gls24 family envelope stress response protein [Zhihengliuella sp.]|uniref:Asp23/Gls24 family envelope stress response protein n=1 Tax=Zhihengliuella sp. TaxID=1954483 RepID=UPI002811AEC5|nr:Asp23/Gls24 family envelope stress response protein [Zhihengliuella sp.]
MHQTLGDDPERQGERMPENHAARPDPSIPGPPLEGAPAAEAPAGSTTISEAAVARVAAAAVRTVPGVYSLGTGAGRALGALRGRVAGANESTAGVSVEVGRVEVAVDVVLTAEYGRPLHEIADDVRAAVYSSVEELTGLRVIEVNVEIGDIQLPPPAGGQSVEPHPSKGETA